MTELKRFLLTCTAVTALAACAFTGCKSEPTAEYIKFDQTAGGNYAVSGYWGGISLNGNVLIPETHEGVPVTAVRTKAFENCKEIKSLAVGGSIYTMGEYTFLNCTNLKSVKIDSPLTLYNGTFKGCTSLTEVDLGPVKGLEGSINGGVFCGCTSLESIVIPATVTRVDAYVFQNCASLKSVVLEGSDFYGVGDAYYFTSRAFSYCPVLENVEVKSPSDSLSSRSGCLLNGDGKVLFVGAATGVIPDGVETIEVFAYEGRNVEELVIPDSVTRIEGYSFRDSSLKRVILPEGSRWTIKNTETNTRSWASAESAPEDIAARLSGEFMHCTWTRNIDAN